MPATTRTSKHQIRTPDLTRQAAKPTIRVTGSNQGVPKMKSLRNTVLSAATLAAAALLVIPASAGAADEAAARALARQSNCFKCHAVDKKKEGPSFKDTAAKYAGKADAQARHVDDVCASSVGLHVALEDIVRKYGGDGDLLS
jgi:cytochrome c